MSTSYEPCKMLEFILNDILSAIKPSQEDWLTRYHIIDELRAVVESVESLRGTTIEPFGSFVSHLFSKWSDLDISVEVPSGSFVSSTKKRQKLELLKDIRRALWKRGDARNLQFIPNARVPLLVYESNHNHRNISCDISINNLPGQIKSKFFLWINQIDGRFHDMVLLVKEWAKAQNINDPKAGTLNSYSLCLLVIFHFQTCVPAILPPLMEIYAGNIVDDFTGERVTAERRIQETCAANLERFRLQSIPRVNGSSLSELFVTFFEKFSRINSMASEYAICTYTGQWEHKKNNSRWMDKKFPLLIEDPFEQPDNAARAVSMNQLIRISYAFEVTHRRLISAHIDKNSIIASLARPQSSSNLMEGTSKENPSSQGARNLGPHPPRVTAVPSPTHNQFHQKPHKVHPFSIAPNGAAVPSPTHNQFQEKPREVHPSSIAPSAAAVPSPSSYQFQRRPREVHPFSIPSVAAAPSPIPYPFQKKPQEARPSSIAPRVAAVSLPTHNQFQKEPQEVRPSSIAPRAAAVPSPPTYNRFQKKPQEVRPSSIAVPRTGQVVHSQVRRVWRPRYSTIQTDNEC